MYSIHFGKQDKAMWTLWVNIENGSNSQICKWWHVPLICCLHRFSKNTVGIEAQWKIPRWVWSAVFLQKKKNLYQVFFLSQLFCNFCHMLGVVIKRSNILWAYCQVFMQESCSRCRMALHYLVIIIPKETQNWDEVGDKQSGRSVLSERTILLNVHFDSSYLPRDLPAALHLCIGLLDTSLM